MCVISNARTLKGPSSKSAPGSTATVTTAQTGLGQTLVDGSGRTLYLFESDSAKDSGCYGTCTGSWPYGGGGGCCP